MAKIGHTKNCRNPKCRGGCQNKEKELTVKELLTMLEAYKIKSNQMFPSIRLYADGSGSLLSDFDQELNEFTRIDELLQILKGA
jgi:hypothetical protein